MNASDQILTIREKSHIAEIVLNRPAKKNAITWEMWSSLPETIREIEDDDRIRVIIIRGASTDFSAGADISEFGSTRSTPEGTKRYEEITAAADASISNCVKPTIAAIEGNCIGGGLEIALSCDLRIAADSARFGITPAKIGLVYGFEATRQLVQTVGISFAKRLLFTAQFVGAEEGIAHNLADVLSSDGQARERALELASLIASRSQASVKGAKKMISRIANGTLVAGEIEERLSLDATSGPDFAEGVAAFLDKRAPDFTRLSPGSRASLEDELS